MAQVTIEPQDLTPAQAASVLDFLNRAKSAAEIAAKVEFPGEPDIGLKLGQRLLDGRAALGGRYTTLAQVDAVPLIGPERFTELCAAVLGLDPHRWLQDLPPRTPRDGTERPTGTPSDAQLDAAMTRILQLTSDYENLRQQFASLQVATERVQVDLTASPQPAWLGQALQIVAYVRDTQGRPLPDRLVTLEASSGTLETAYGFAVQRARAVSVRTGADGSARLTLRSHTIEPLTADQQAALEDALGQLDAGADSPNLLRSSYLKIAAAYQDERRQALRAAFDIYARQWKAQFFDQLNPGSLGFQWPIETCVVRADCHPQDGSAAALTTAVLVARWKNWVGAWFEFLGEYLNEQSKLQFAFNAAKGRGAKGYRLVDDLLGEAHSFVADQKGLAAEWLSQRVVKVAMNDFLGRELGGVDDETQRELFSSLEGAATQLTRQSRGAIAMVTQTRVDLDDKITKVGGINADVLGEIRGLHAEVLSRASQVNTQFTAINAAKAELDGRMSQFDSRFATFTTQFADFGQRYSTFNTDYGKFNNDYGDFRTRYDDIGGRLTVFDQGLATFNQNLGRFNTDYGDFRTRVDTIGGRLNTFDQSFASFNQSLAGFNQNLGKFNTDLGSFQTQRAQITQDLNAVKADLNTVKTDLTGVKRDIGTVRTDIGLVRTELGTVRTDVGAVRTELGTVKADVGTVRTDLGAVKINVNTLNTRITPGPGRIG
jgi:archaellum component FlaC